MVYLSRIYTRRGDAGETDLGDGNARPKDDARIHAYGEIDELNSVIGVAIARADAAGEVGLLGSVQNDLFDLGADLCVPEVEGDGTPRLRVTAEQALHLESEIDRLNADLSPLRSFVLPGGSTHSADLHVARAVCRRAERAVVTLAQREKVNSNVLVYLNRLSDLLFVLARNANLRSGRPDVLWEPAKSQKSDPK